MKEILTSPIFTVTLTVVIFFLSQQVYHRWKYAFLNPVLLSILILIAFLKLSHVSYDAYAEGTRIISFFLGPAVVALGVPLYLQLEKLRTHGKYIFVSIGLGSVVGILSAAGIAGILGASQHVVVSLAPKSVTTPIAMGITEKLDGIPSLTAAIVVITGIVGTVIGPVILRAIGIHSPTAFGLAMGTAAHGLGTARAVEEGETQGAMSGLALCVNGVMTALLTPVLLKLLTFS